MDSLVWGEHTSDEAIELIQGLDRACATRWVTYLHPTVDMSKIDVANIPAIKRAVNEKRQELFDQKPKPYALVCGSQACEQYFDFWQKYYSNAPPAFCRLDEAYDWLGLSEAARAVASRVIESWEVGAGLRDFSSGPTPTSARKAGLTSDSGSPHDRH